jgi:subfamily B ATP-binding cassette protein MsbA
LKRTWREIAKPQLKWLILGILAAVGTAAAEAYAITLVKEVIDVGFIERKMNILYIVALQIIAAFFAKSAFAYSKQLLLNKAGLTAGAILRSRIYHHMVRMHVGIFHESNTGKLINYYTVQAVGVLNMMTNVLINSIQHGATVRFMLGLMIYYAPQMVLILLFMIPGIMIPFIWIMRKKRRLTRKSFGITAESTSHVSQSIQGIKTIQSFATEPDESDYYNQIESAARRTAYKNVQVSALQSPLLEIMIAIGIAGALILGGHFIVSGQMTTGAFTAFILALTAAYQPAKKIMDAGNGIQHGLIAAEQLFEFLDTKSNITDAPNAKILKSGPIDVAVNKVSFAYNKSDGNILNDISFKVPAGTVCALVGPSGGGKSTVFNLLLRFYDPLSGSVSFNGTDIKKLTLKSLRENIAVVSQDVFLFNGSVYDNIRYGNPNATDKQIYDAARAANAHDFITKELPNGYHSSVGERGANLSGGQKQRIAIARAILKDAPVLLLDEATSALDTQSEKLIQSALDKLMKGRTTFVIAHRLSTILDADQILVIKDGHIVERGTDKDL